MGVMTHAQLGKLIVPGLQRIFGLTLARYPKEFPIAFEVKKSIRAYEEHQGMAGTGLARVKTPGASIQYDQENQSYVTKYTHVTYAKGIAITEEAMEDNLYKEQANLKGANLGFGINQTMETVAANILNRAADGGYVGGDGQPLLSTAHPLFGVEGGSTSNKLASNAVLSELAIEQLLIQIADTRDDANLRIALRPLCLIIPPALTYTAARILNSTLQSHTPDNAINAIRSTNMLPEGAKVMHFLTNKTQWFIKTDCPNGLIFQERRAPRLKDESDFNTSNLRYKADVRFSVGWSDFKQIHGSEGS